MKNIIWKKPDGYYAITSIAGDESDSHEHAEQLLENGAINETWVIEATDVSDLSDYPSSPAPLAQQALAALAKSDLTMTRIAEAVSLELNQWASADVLVWVNYRKDLRAIVDGSDTTSITLPERPEYPAGT